MFSFSKSVLLSRIMIAVIMAQLLLTHYWPEVDLEGFVIEKISIMQDSIEERARSFEERIDRYFRNKRSTRSISFIQNCPSEAFLSLKKELQGEFIRRTQREV